MKINKKSIVGTIAGVLLSGVVTAMAIATVNSFRKPKDNNEDKNIKEV